MKSPLAIGASCATALTLAVGIAFTAGRETVPPPKPAVPSNEQLTIAASTLVHGLEVQNDYSLSASPDFIACHAAKKPIGGLACDFRVSYLDESSENWELTLDRHNAPVLVRKLKHSRTAAPPA